MRIRNKLAGVAAGAIAVSGIVAVALPTAANAFGPTNNTLKCWVHDNTTPGDISSTAASWPDGTVGHTTNGATLTVSAGPYTVGTPITVTNTYSEGPKNGPFAVTGETSTVKYQITQGANVTIVTGTPQNSFSVGAGGYGPGFTNTDPVTPVFPGATSISVYSVDFNATALGLQVTTACNANTGNTATVVAPGPPWTGGPNPFVTPTVTTITETLATNVIGPSATVTAVSSQFAGVTSAVRPPDTVTVTGNTWTASGAITGVTVGGIAATANTLVVDGSGNLTGTFTTAAATPTGNQNIVINQGTKSATVGIRVLGAPTVSLSPNSGAPSQSVTMTGTNFDPLRPASAVQCSGAPGPCTVGPPFNNGTAIAGAAVDANGALTITPSTFTVLATTTFVGASQFVSAGPPPVNRIGTAFFTVTSDACTAQTGDTTGGSGCTTLQGINALINAGNLKQQAFNTNLGSCVYAPNASGQPYVGTAPQNVPADGVTRLIGNRTSTQINLGYLTVSSAVQTLTGCINRVHVTDQRGGNFGWSLTATMPNFTDAAAHTIAQGALAITPACGIDPLVPLSAAGVTAGGAAQTFASVVTLCTKDTTVGVQSQSTAGEYDITGPLTLTVPQFQHYGDYNSVISIKLV